MLQAGMIIAGWDASEGGAVYALPLGGTLLKVPFSIGGLQSAGSLQPVWVSTRSERQLTLQDMSHGLQSRRTSQAFSDGMCRS